MKRTGNHFLRARRYVRSRRRESLILQRTRPIHSALSLMVVMVALAGLYLLMGADSWRRANHRLWRRHHGAVRLRLMLLNAGAEERTNLSK